MLHRLRVLSGRGQIRGRQSDEHLLQILAGFDHAPEMRGSDLQTPGIGQGMTGFAAQVEKVGMPQREHALLTFFPLGPDDELDVYGVGVADRDSCLQPAKLDLPDSLKRIGAGFKSARIIGH